jgi:hypothetical protein
MCHLAPDCASNTPRIRPGIVSTAPGWAIFSPQVYGSLRYSRVAHYCSRVPSIAIKVAFQLWCYPRQLLNLASEWNSMTPGQVSRALWGRSRLQWEPPLLQGDPRCSRICRHSLGWASNGLGWGYIAQFWASFTQMTASTVPELLSTAPGSPSMAPVLAFQS